jgi:4-amino-4-deoxy-L-arabinose transferase-like glycosyltransferase
MEPRRQRRSSADAVGLALVLVAIVALPLLAAGRITARFGDSDEGINGAVWATNSRALRELGVSESRFGGRRADGTLYASHPPGIVAETAAAETLFGEREWASRMPAWLGSMAAIAVLFVLLRAVTGPLAAGGATAAVALTPMYLVYGSMLDTPVTSFVFGLAVLSAWHALWEGRSRWFTTGPALVVLALLAALAGWQATVLVGLCGLSLIVRGLRSSDHPTTPGVLLLVGGAAGALCSFSWAWWTYGGLDVLREKFTGRSAGGEAGSVIDMITFQVPWLLQLLAFGVIGLVACCFALRAPRYRPLAAMSLSVVVLYATVFHAAAAGHQYWNYWALLPTAVGFAYLLERLAGDARSHAPVAVAGAVAALALANGLIAPRQAADAIARGHRAVDALLTSPLPGDSMVVRYVGQEFRPNAWIAYYTGRKAEPIRHASELAALAATRPEEPVLVLGWCAAGDPGEELCSAATAALGTGEPAIVTSDSLRRRLATASSGPAG